MGLESQIERGGSGVTPKGLKTRSVPARSVLCQLFVGLVVRVNSSACGGFLGLPKLKSSSVQ